MNISDMIIHAREGVYFTQLGLAIFGVYLLIVMFRQLSRKKFASQASASQFLEQVDEKLQQRDIDGVAEICDSPAYWSKAVPQLVIVALQNPQLNPQKLRRHLGETFEREVLADFDFRSSWIVTIVRAAPMLGLLGTVLALIAAFEKIATVQTQGNDPSTLGRRHRPRPVDDGVRTGDRHSADAGGQHDSRASRHAAKRRAASARRLPRNVRGGLPSEQREARMTRRTILSGESAEEQWGTKVRKPHEADIDVTPLVDCVFLLLAFFMMTSPMKGNPDKNLPTALHGGPINPNSATMIRIAEAEPSPHILLNDRESTIDDVRPFVEEGLRKGHATVVIKADKKIPCGLVQKVAKAITSVEGVRFCIGVLDKPNQ